MKSEINLQTPDCLGSFSSKDIPSLPLQDKTNSFIQLHNRLSPKRAKPTKSLFAKKEINIKNADFMNVQNPFTKVGKTNQIKYKQDIIECKPIKDSQNINPDLYKFIGFEVPYQPQLEMIDKMERKHSGMNTISCHTVSKYILKS